MWVTEIESCRGGKDTEKGGVVRRGGSNLRGRATFASSIYKDIRCCSVVRDATKVTQQPENTPTSQSHWSISHVGHDWQIWCVRRRKKKSADGGFQDQNCDGGSQRVLLRMELGRVYLPYLVSRTSSSRTEHWRKHRCFPHSVVGAVQRFGPCSAWKPCALPSVWVSILHVQPTLTQS